MLTTTIDTELAQHYDAIHSGRPAMTLPMDYVFEWAERNTKRFFISNDDTIHLQRRT